MKIADLTNALDALGLTYDLVTDNYGQLVVYTGMKRNGDDMVEMTDDDFEDEDDEEV